MAHGHVGIRLPMLDSRRTQTPLVVYKRSILSGLQTSKQAITLSPTNSIVQSISILSPSSNPTAQAAPILSPRKNNSALTSPLFPSRNSTRNQLRLALDTHPRHRQTHHGRQPSQANTQREGNPNAVHVRGDDTFKLGTLVHGPQSGRTHRDDLCGV